MNGRGFFLIALAAAAIAAFFAAAPPAMAEGPATPRNKFRCELYINHAISGDATSWTPVRGTPDMIGNLANMSAADFIEGRPWPVDIKASRFYFKAGGLFFFHETSNYEFFARRNGPLRVYIDDRLALDLWNAVAGSETVKFQTALSAGWHKIKVKYVWRGGDVIAELGWSPRVPPIYNSFYKELFANERFAGPPALTTVETGITYNYLRASPFSPDSAYAGKRDYFSARWAGEFFFPQDAAYRFFLSGDDAVELYVGEKLSASASWGDVSEKVRLSDGSVLGGKIVDIFMPAGTHEIRFDHSEVFMDARAALIWWKAGLETGESKGGPAALAYDMLRGVPAPAISARLSGHEIAPYESAEVAAAGPGGGVLEAFADGGFSSPLAEGAKIASGARVYVRYSLNAAESSAGRPPVLKISSEDDEHGLMLATRAVDGAHGVYTAFFITDRRTAPEAGMPRIRATAPCQVRIEPAGGGNALCLETGGAWLPAFGNASEIEGASSPDLFIRSTDGEFFADHDAYLACVGGTAGPNGLFVARHDPSTGWSEPGGVSPASMPARRPSIFVFEQPGSENLIYAAFEDIARGGAASVAIMTGGERRFVGEPAFTNGPAANVTLWVCDLGAPVPYAAFRDQSADGRASLMAFEDGKWSYVGTRGFTPGPAGAPALSFLPTARYQYPCVAFIDEERGGRISVMKYNRGLWEYMGPACISDEKSSGVSLSCESGVAYAAYADGGRESRASVVKFNGGDWEYLGERGFSATGAEGLSVAVSEGSVYLLFIEKRAGGAVRVMKHSRGGWRPLPELPAVAGAIRSAKLRVSDGSVYVALEEQRRGGAGAVKAYKYD